MATAYTFAQCSTAQRLKVGCIIVKDDRIISIGYNGTPSGTDNTCEDISYKNGFGYLVTKPEVLHAEANAITKLARSHESGLGSVMFCTHSPCFECSKLIYQSGIHTLYYSQDYRDSKGIEFLTNLGINVIHHT